MDVVDWAATSEAFQMIIEGAFEVVIEGQLDSVFLNEDKHSHTFHSNLFVFVI